MKNFQRVLLLTVLFLLLSLSHINMVSKSGGFFLSSSYAYFGFGFPFSSLKWNVDSYYLLTGGEGIVVSSSDRVISGSFIPFAEMFGQNDQMKFDLVSSLWGFGANLVFWYVVSFLVYFLWKKVLSIYDYSKARLLIVVSLLLAGLTFFLPSIDLSQNVAVSRGAPFAYLERAHLYGGGYAEVYNTLPFMFVLDALIFWTLVAMLAVFFGKLQSRGR